eukprot:6722331-Ditylum_brightwellii.AAC.1
MLVNNKNTKADHNGEYNNKVITVMTLVKIMFQEDNYINDIIEETEKIVEDKNEDGEANEGSKQDEEILFV